MSNICYPYKISQHAPNDVGKLNCIGIYSKAINFLTQHGKLLTLHRGGTNLTPMGWLLAEDNFDAAAELLADNQPSFLFTEGIKIGSLHLTTQTQHLNLKLISQLGTISIDVLRNILSNVSNQTGLCGCLDQIVKRPMCSVQQQFTVAFSSMLEGRLTNIHPLIGLGPGLTPSSDDMWVGMLATFFAFANKKLPISFAIFNDYQQLQILTTTVSSCFLIHASKGCFSSQILSLFDKALDEKALTIKINALLDYGHTSGADVLLGIWLGLSVLHHPKPMR